MNMCPTNAWTILFLNPLLCARKENRNRIYMDENVIQIRKEVHYWLGKRCFKIVMGVARGLLFQQYVT